MSIKREFTYGGNVQSEVTFWACDFQGCNRIVSVNNDCISDWWYNSDRHKHFCPLHHNNTTLSELGYTPTPTSTTIKIEVTVDGRLLGVKVW